MEFTDTELADWIGQLSAYLLQRLGARELARELAQESAARLLKVLDDGQEIRNPRAWIFQVGRNLAVDEVRKRLPHAVGLEWRSREVDPASVEEDEHLMGMGGLEVPRSEVLRIMPEAMSRLAHNDRGYLDSYYCKGRDFDWIAKQQELSVSTIKGRLFRARKRLREQIVHQVRQEQGQW